MFFSASPKYKDALKEAEWLKIKWDAEFAELKSHVNKNLTANSIIELQWEFYESKGTTEQLVDILEGGDAHAAQIDASKGDDAQVASRDSPVILIIGCHGDEATGELQFSSPDDADMPHSIDADTLDAVLHDVKSKIAFVVFDSCHSTKLAASV